MTRLQAASVTPVRGSAAEHSTGRVRRTPAIRVTAPRTVKNWESAVITASAAPFDYKRYVGVQRRVGTKWRYIPTAYDRIEANGTSGSHAPARISVIMNRLGTQTFRIRVTSEVGWYLKTSAPFTITVTPNDYTVQVVAPGEPPTTGNGSGVGIGMLGVGNGISDDGKYAAFTTSRALDPADQNNEYDLYWRNLDNGDVKWVSRNLAAGEHRPATRPDISATGRYVVYTVGKKNWNRVYWWDSQTDRSIPIDEVDGGYGVQAQVTADGRWVLLDTPAGDGLWDSQTQTFRLLTEIMPHEFDWSVNLKGAVISDDGRWIAFVDIDYWTDPSTDDPHEAVLLFDRVNSTMERVEAGDRVTSDPVSDDDTLAISANGDTLMYPMVAFDQDSVTIRRWTRATGVTTALGPLHVSKMAYSPLFDYLRLSPDGTQAVFMSETPDLWPHDPRGGYTHPYLWSAADNTVQPIPAELTGLVAGYPSINGDGSRIIFAGWTEGAALTPIRYGAVLLWNRQTPNK